MFLLCIGLYMVFPASQTALRLHSEKNTPYEIIVSVDNARINMDVLSQIEGVEAVSPILQLDFQAVYGEKTASFAVDAVYSSYLDLHLIDGVIFTDNTNMPYLLMNEAAAKAFSEKDTDMGIHAQETVTVKCGDSECKAAISGIFRDEETIPKVYISYDVARKLFASQGGGTNIAFRLTNKGSVDSVVSQLQRKGVSASADSDASLAWELLEQQTWQPFMTSISFLLCSIMLFHDSSIIESETRKGERDVLSVSGMTTQQIRCIGFLRSLLVSIISLNIVSWISCLTGKFSFLAVVICTILICVQFVLRFLVER